MKGQKLVAALVALATITITPKTLAQDYLTTQEVLPLLPNSTTSNYSHYLSFILAGNSLESGDYTAAVQHFTEALKGEPDNVYAYFGRGLSQFMLRKYPEAKTDFYTATEINSDFAYGYFGHGLTLFMLGNQPGAIADLEKASRLFEKDGSPEFSQMADSMVKIIQMY
jgi:tetratricopeptide (TPR) repeat protein